MHTLKPTGPLTQTFGEESVIQPLKRIMSHLNRHIKQSHNQHLKAERKKVTEASNRYKELLRDIWRLHHVRKAVLVSLRGMRPAIAVKGVGCYGRGGVRRKGWRRIGRT